jgi:hypothetical protein
MIPLACIAIIRYFKQKRDNKLKLAGLDSK